MKRRQFLQGITAFAAAISAPVFALPQSIPTPPIKMTMENGRRMYRVEIGEGKHFTTLKVFSLWSNRVNLKEENISIVAEVYSNIDSEGMSPLITRGSNTVLVQPAPGMGYERPPYPPSTPKSRIAALIQAINS